MDAAVEDAWAALDHLVSTGVAPAAYTRTPQPTQREAVVCEDGHVCSDRCFFLQRNDNDDAFVCTLSGLMWGKQICNGSYDRQNQVQLQCLAILSFSCLRAG